VPRRNNKKSGFTSLPARVKIRELDKLKNKHSSILRTGDKDRQGNYTINFDDTLTHVFGKRIADTFEESGFDNTTIVNQKKWNTSQGQLIKREIVNKKGVITENRCFVFAGRGDASGRWIQTTDKIKNPIINFDVVIGPHNNVKNGLNLKRPLVSDELVVQIQVPGSAWRTIKTIKANLNLLSFYNVDNKILPVRPRKRITLTEKDFNTTASFYLRIIQSIDDYFAAGIGYKTSTSTWAISNINIVSNNQNVIYPVVNNAESSGMQVINTTVSNTHTTSSIMAIGRIHPGISDTGYIDRDFDENITAFDEKISVSNAGISFLETSGVDAAIYDGYSQKFLNKTRIDVDLTPSEATEFGYVTPYENTTTARTSNDGQQLMVYWNNVLKKWEKIAQPLTLNSTTTAGGDITKAINNLRSVLTSSAMGFSSIGIIASGSNIDVLTGSNLLEAEVINSYNRPIATANFPFGGQYHATGSQWIKAKDIGINHPFLLEGTSLFFDAELEIAGSPVGETTSVWEQFGTAVAYPKTGEPSKYGIDSSIKTIIPSFFMLRQFKDNFEHYNQFRVNFSVGGGSNLYEHFSQIPGNYELISGSQNSTLVTDTRELITYKQITYILSSSSDASMASPMIGNIQNVQKLLDAGLGREENIVIEQNYSHAAVHSITGSYKINSKVKIPARLNSFIPYKISGSHYSNDELLLGNDYGGRQRGNIDASSRALYNGNVSIENGPSFLYPASSTGNNPIIMRAPKLNDIDKFSPYIILPEDKLIFGWQYPLENYSTTKIYLNGSLSRNSIRLLNNGKLELYGSLIRNNKEYHNTRNQNLTSLDIHETTAEEIIDRFQISQSGEMTGSYSDNRLIVLNAGKTAVLNSGNQITENPVERIGTLICSYTNLKKSLIERVADTSLLDYPQVYSDISSQMKGLNKFTKATSENLFYKDNLRPLSFYYDFSRYGNKFDLIKGSKDSDIIFKDTKFNFLNKGLFLGPAVKVTFVSEESEEDLLKIKSYNRKSVKDLLADYVFQSSNLSTACTSSLPFYDDNTPRNRTYIIVDDLISV
jgi:hypothetical protein